MTKTNNFRLIAIGDIHGEYFKLVNLLNKLHLTSDDILVFLGDYVDRGLYSRQVVNALIELSKTNECHFLKGNHEYFMLKALNGDEHADYFFMTYGGVETIQSYGFRENIIGIHSDFYNNLKTYYETEKYIFVHGGIKPNIKISETNEFDLLMIRDEFIYNPTNLNKKIVFGHTPFEKPYIAKDKIGIDTGSGKFKKSCITAFICNDETFIQSDLSV